MEEQAIVINIKNGLVDDITGIPPGYFIEIRNWDTEDNVGYDWANSQKIPISEDDEQDYYQDPESLDVASRMVVRSEEVL